MSLVAETTKQRRETGGPSGAAAAWDGNGPRFPGRGSPRTASWRRTIPSSSTSSSIRPPQWSAKPGSWLPTIQVQSSVAGQPVRSSRALGRQPVAAEAVVEAVAEAIEARRAGALDLARRARSASRANHKAGGTARAARTSSLFRGAGRRPAAPSAPARKRAVGGREECFACERKGNHAAGCNAGRRGQI